MQADGVDTTGADLSSSSSSSTSDVNN